MRPVLTYAEYKELGGGLGEQAFSSGLPEAASLVDWMTAPRDVVASNQREYLGAIAAVIDSHAQHGSGDIPVIGYKIGSFSTTGAGGHWQPTGRSLAMEAAERRMARAVPSLLYGGVA